MCESSAYLLEDGEETLLLESVDLLESLDGQVYIQSMFGEKRRLRARVKTLSLIDHKIILEPV
ncbi:MAG: CooT family nickel-binding protein [Deltaproteobacteria bacterium]